MTDNLAVMEEIKNATHDYVGIAECGCVLAIAVDYPSGRKRVAQACKEFVSGGLRLERWEHERVRVAKMGCEKCNPKAFAKQLDLMPASSRIQA